MIVELTINFLTEYYKDIFIAVLVYMLIHVASKRLSRNLGDGRKDVMEKSVFVDEAPPLPAGEAEEFGPDPEEKEVPMIPYSMTRLTEAEMCERSSNFYKLLNSRRTCRSISTEPVPKQVIEKIVHTAGTGPSGAHTEPWTYIAVNKADLKKQLREMIEEEEYINYTRRMGNKWVQDLQSLRTSWEKQYIEDAPWIILVFRQTHGFTPSGTKKTHYYSEISVSLSIGILISAITNAGLVCVTHTPLNVGPQLRKLFQRPNYEKFVMLLPVGYPSSIATVPDLKRKPLREILHVYD